MKKVLLNFFVLLCTAFGISAQAVIINSPPSIAGVYLFSAAAFGADITTDVWTGDAAIVNDGTSNPSQGCQPLINGMEISGKFAFIDRGTCEFGAKCLNAQNAGATACIVFNHTAGAGTIVMGAGAVGGSVTIPCVMVSYEDGLKIKAALKNGAVNVSIGNIKFANDLATNNRTGICHAPFGTFPFSWVRKVGDYILTPGASVTNKGLNIVPNVKVNAKIAFTPTGGSSTEFYNKTSGDGLYVEVDSTNDVFLEPQDLFGHAGPGPGKGTISYYVSSDSTETSTTDNSAISEFYLSNNLISKARLAANGRDPFVTTSYRRSDGAPAEFLAGFKIPYGKGCKIDSVLFNLAISAPATLANLTPEATLYGWFDANGNNRASNDEISFLALGTYTYDAGETRTSAIARVPLEDINTSEAGFTIPEDNFGVFVGVRYSGSEPVFYGFDEGIDYSCNNTILQNAGTLAISDLPYVGITGYDANTGVPDIDNASFSFTALSAPIASSLVLSGPCIVVNDNQLSDLEATLKIYPNPVKDRLLAELTLNEVSSKIVYNVIDNSGRLIFQKADLNSGKEYRAHFNVQNLMNGLYHLQIRTDKGIKQVSFEVIH